MLDRRFIVYSEMVEAGQYAPLREEGVADEVNLVVNDPGDPASMFEFTIRLFSLGTPYSVQLQMFSDSWQAFREVPEVFNLLHSLRSASGRCDLGPWLRMLDSLEELGWRRVGSPPGGGRRKCPSCGQRIRGG